MASPKGKINSIEDLRDFALETLEKLTNGEIDTTQAGLTGKLCENVISTVKSQLEYYRMTDQQAHIPFMQKSYHPVAQLEGAIEYKKLDAPSK